MAELFYIALAWAGYGFMHSWFASNRIKLALTSRWPVAMRGYRLLYNILAVVLLIPPLWLTWKYSGPLVMHWPIWFSWPIAAITVAGFVWSMKWYDGMDFMGWRQLVANKSGGGLALSPMHRYVRHPWYALGLLFLWTRDANAGWLVAYVAITLYMLIGIHLEEQKLIANFGDAYRMYRKRVPALIPLPGRTLTAEDAANLEALAQRQQQG